MTDENHDNRQLELDFDREGDDEPIHYTRKEAGGTPTCGTCGEPIRGEVYVNHFGPAHYRCWLRETL